MKKKEALKEIFDMKDSRYIDKYIVGILKEHFDDIVEPTLEKQKISEEQYRQEIESKSA